MPLRVVRAGTDDKALHSVFPLVLEFRSVGGVDLELGTVSPALHSECWGSRPVLHCLARISSIFW